jgi:hypothetical protein
MLSVSLVPLSMLAVSLLVATYESSAPSDGAQIEPSNEMTSGYVETGYRQ